MKEEQNPDLDESIVSLAQRRARGMRLRRMQKRIQRARALQMKRTADPARLMRRATKAAYKMFRTRLSGGKDYASLGPSEKIGIDKRLQKLLPVIKKFATRLIPQVRRKEQMRRKSMMSHQNEAFTDFMLERKGVPQDPDIKDKPGTQPKVYYKGLDKETKEKRAAHFKKMGPRPDDDKSAYVDAPGDKEAREKGLPQSKHTKKYKQMFGEELDKKDMQRLDMLVRMGLADKKYLSLIKRSIGKLDSGETMSPQERQASFDLLQTLLDMTLSTDAIFRMTRSQVQKGKMAEEMDLNELSYKGNIGIMEFAKFFQKANNEQITQMKKLLSRNMTAQALKLLHDVTGTKLQEDLGIGRALSPITHFASYSKAKKTLKDLMARKSDSTKGIGYYALQVAKQHPGVDPKKLMAMMKEDSDWEERDGLQMAQIEVANMAQDVEELAELLDMMDEEPEAWVLSKITKAADYIESVKNYLEFEDDFDDDEEDDDEDEMDDMDFETEFFNMMREDGIVEEVQDIFEEIEGLKKKAEKSKIPYGILKKVYDRGMAAWQGGHRPGTTAQQWAFARVNSFITKGKGTWGGADSDLAAKVKKNEEFVKQFSEAQEIGTDAIRIAYARMTPGQNIDLVTAKYETDKVLNVLNDIRTQRAKKLFDEEKNVVKEAIEMHLEKKIPFVENVFRVGSENYFEFFREARAMGLQLEGHDKYLIEETDIGEIVEFEGQMVPLDCPMVEEWEIIDENLSILSKWRNKEPVQYAKYLTKHFGMPDELTEKRAIWHDKDGFKRIEVLDEFILHASPVPHYDFVYCYADIKVPHELAEDLAKSSESITIDFLKNEVGARCASLTANAVTLNYVIEVVEGRVKPSKQEYEKQIKAMKNMFASGKKFELDWWSDESGDADPKNPYYNLKEEDEKNPPLNQPKRGGPKKFYVYVKDGDKIKKVTWGDTTGLSVKLNDPEARKSFAARHQCSMQKDRTSAAYWACNTPRYAKQLGLSGGGQFFW